MSALFTSATEAAPEAGWPAGPELDEVTARLRELPPLVALEDCLELRRRLAEVAAGRAHLIHGGDCAELFAEVSAHTVRRKAAQLPEHTPGRLTFGLRCGAGQVERILPPLVRAAAVAGVRPVWLCDPMHGNTLRSAGGRKIRRTADITAEIRSFVRELRRLGEHPGGLHLELTPDDVTECVQDPDDGAEQPRYWTGCDPRLNPAQARAALAAFIEEAA